MGTFFEEGRCPIFAAATIRISKLERCAALRSKPLTSKEIVFSAVKPNSLWQAQPLGHLVNTPPAQGADGVDSLSPKELAQRG